MILMIEHETELRGPSLSADILVKTSETLHKIDAIVRTVIFNSVSCFSCDILKSHEVALEADGMVAG